ncbi:MAG: Na+/H+ antiporter [Kofleriaceae bacterium]|nr:Na+/H+ antiporter [Kofleriaceae bacterium]
MDGAIHLLLLLGVLVVVALIAQRVHTAPSILLLLAGIVLAAIPSIPTIDLPPEFVLLVLLPPLIYSAGVAMSWREFRFNLRPISLLAIGAVVFTTLAIMVALHGLLGMPWALGFLLGAIIAPPDVVAPLAIARRLHMPRRLVVVLEGEGLANDATALILYRFAVVAVVSGGFSLGRATGTFALILVGELVFGIGVGWLSLRLRHWAHDPRIELTMSLMTPYVAYWIPAHLGGSGVLATVATGLYVSWNGPLLISSATRLQGIFFWDFIIYLIEGGVFLVTGLQMRTLLERVDSDRLPEMLVATAITAAVAIVARFTWVFPAVYVPRYLSKALAQRDPAPTWHSAFVVAFTGIRGVVSLAAALGLPMVVANGRPFPERDLILFVTFGVIVITLVGQGLMLPAVIRKLGLAHTGKAERHQEEEAEREARALALATAARQLDAIEAERNVSADVVRLLRTGHEDRAQRLPSDLEGGLALTRRSAALRTEIIGEERKVIHQLLREGKLSDESRRRIERELDLEEESIAFRREGETPL